ncbi:MAG: hypothetical protein HY808_02120 [Nitrospirae bacterium]|nr:hypothetical protein [Nitrospirota bacterium]
MKKALSIFSASITATLITFILSGAVYAFHEGGVGYYYGRNIVAEFGSYQRQLCNKCHQRD